MTYCNPPEPADICFKILYVLVKDQTCQNLGLHLQARLYTKCSSKDTCLALLLSYEFRLVKVKLK